MSGILKIRRILCPIDLSEFSRRAVDHAIALARWYEADLTALFVFSWAPPPGVGIPHFPVPLATDEGVRSAVAKDLEAFLSPARAGAPKVPVHFAYREGDVAVGIVEEARELDADLLVMGTHGRSGFERFLLGSTTEKVLRRAPCPVLTVSRPPEGSPPPEALFKRMLCALDLQEGSAGTLDYALSIGEEADALLTVLHVVEGLPVAVPRSGGLGLPEIEARLVAHARERLAAAVPGEARDWCEIEEVVVAGKPYREILRIAEDRKAGLIVMGIHGASPVDRMFLGSTANHVVRGAACPVLTVRAVRR